MPILWTDKAIKIVKKKWNYDHLKDKQIEIINELLDGNDVVGLLPTGYGKSMCYILPPLLTKKTIFIISPLIALMDEQKEKLIEKKIKVSVLHSYNDNKNEDIINILEGKILIVYMSPEYLTSNGLTLAGKLIEKNLLGYLAIDESHCLSSWGHDFRQSYLQIKKFRELYPLIPIMAVTATATTRVVNEIASVLKLKNPKIVRGSFDRPNLLLKCYEIPVQQVTKKITKTMLKQIYIIQTIKEYIQKYDNQKIIIYVNTRKNSDMISAEINKWKKCCNSYHAGMEKGVREEILNQFISGDIKIVIATTAFGMGIDQIVRCVMIIGCSQSIEEYYQQIGRCGRDDLQSETIFIFDKQSFASANFNAKKNPNKNNVIEKLKKINEFVYINTCRRRFIIDYFELPKNENYFQSNSFNCNNCDNCINQELHDITKEIYDYKINKKKLNININNIKNLENTFNMWKDYIIDNNYNIDTLPDKLLIKLPSIEINTDVGNIDEDIFDKCTKIINDILC